MKTLEEIALQVAKDAAMEISGASAAEMTPEAEAWSLAFARRLVAALGAQEPVAYFVQEETQEGIEYGYSASYPEAVHEHINDVIQRLVDVDIKPNVMHCVPLYAAPYIKEGWQMVPKEPTPEMVAASWYAAGSVRFGDGQEKYIAVAYQAMLAAAPEYGK